MKVVESGVFGPIYTQFKYKPAKAIAWLKKKKTGEAKAALFHPEIGDIDIVYGTEGTSKSNGFGLAKLIKYHPEVLRGTQTILNAMKVVSKTNNRVRLESNLYEGAVSLLYFENEKTWLLTLFKKKSAKQLSGKSMNTAKTKRRKR